MQNDKKINKKAFCATALAFLLPPMLISAILYSPPISFAARQATITLAAFSFGATAVTDGTAFLTTGSEAPAVMTISQPNIRFKLDEAVAISKDTLSAFNKASEDTEALLEINELPYIIPEGSEDLPYPLIMECKSGMIKEVNYGFYSGSQFFSLDGGGIVKNCTTLSNDTIYEQSKIPPEIKIEASAAAPQVLIMHTHTTESFEPYERDFFDASFISRTTDNTKNVVAVGEAIAQELKAAGIEVIHDVTVHDYPEYNGSYERSRATVEKMLKEYPSIKIVLDIHRDAICSSDGTRNAPVAEVGGKKAAQIMIVSCCDDGTAYMPEYMQNFSLASLLQQELESDYPGITRPLLFDCRHYNQELTTGSLLIEIGSHANSIDQAIYSGQLFGESLSEVLLALT